MDSVGVLDGAIVTVLAGVVGAVGVTGRVSAGVAEAGGVGVSDGVIVNVCVGVDVADGPGEIVPVPTPETAAPAERVRRGNAKAKARMQETNANLRWTRCAENDGDFATRLNLR